LYGVCLCLGCGTWLVFVFVFGVVGVFGLVGVCGLRWVYGFVFFVGDLGGFVWRLALFFVGAVCVVGYRWIGSLGVGFFGACVLWGVLVAC